MIEIHFDSERASLEATLPLPPTDNHCHRSGRWSRYATAEYREWLALVNPYLVEALGDWEPDRERWWLVGGVVRLGKRRGDPLNYLKPIVDALTGSRVEQGVVVHPGALWDDDARVSCGGWVCVEVGVADPVVEIVVRPAGWTPAGWKAKKVRAT